MMSYEPNRETKSELMSAWNSASQSLPVYYNTVPNTSDANFDFAINTVGEGDASIISNTLTPSDNAYGFFIGDVRANTYRSSGVQVHGDLHTIRFLHNDGDLNQGGQVQRANRNDDQCYSIASSAKLQMRTVLRSSGNTIAPYVRILGVLINKE